MKKIRLGDVVSFSKGQQINGDELMKKGRYDYLNGGINPSGCWNDFNVTGDTVTVSEGGNSCGYVNYMSYPFWCGAHCYYLYDSKLNNKYLYYALKSQQEKIMKLRTGACMPNIKKTDLGKFELYITTDINAQELTVFILDKITDLIDKRKKQLEKLDELVKSRFIELFGDCLTNPKGWKTKCLEDIADVGSSKRVFVEELREDGIPFFRGTEVGALAEGKSVSPELFITEEHYAALCTATGAPQIGDLLMPSICPDGRIWVVNTDKPFYFKDGRVLWVHSIDISFNPVFLLYTLKDRIMTDYNSIASGTTFAELKIFALKKCRVFDAPLDLQNEFAAFVEQVDKSKFEIKQSLEKLELLKKALMQKYFG